jgi:hypothetical protein
MGVERTIGAIRHDLRDFDAEQAVAGGQIDARRGTPPDKTGQHLGCQ